MSAEDRLIITGVELGTFEPSKEVASKRVTPGWSASDRKTSEIQGGDLAEKVTSKECKNSKNSGQ